VTECIHGLELSRCDLCSPKVLPKPDLSTTTTRARTPRPLASSTPRRSTPPASKTQPLNVNEQRIHHVTHISNLDGILTSSGLVADASDARSARPTVDISSESNREARRSTFVAGVGSPNIANYVPFYLSPNASLWEAQRAGSTDPRLSPTTRGLPASEFVLLVSTVSKVAEASRGDDTIIVADGDAVDPRTRFATSKEAYDRMLRRVLSDQESSAMLRAEFLAKDTVPFETITLIGVANDKARDAVKAILGSSDYRPRVAVHPPWFALPADA
jgi:hypothetical protein